MPSKKNSKSTGGASKNWSMEQWEEQLYTAEEGLLKQFPQAIKEAKQAWTDITKTFKSIEVEQKKADKFLREAKKSWDTKANKTQEKRLQKAEDGWQSCQEDRQWYKEEMDVLEDNWQYYKESQDFYKARQQAVLEFEKQWDQQQQPAVAISKPKKAVSSSIKATKKAKKKAPAASTDVDQLIDQLTLNMTTPVPDQAWEVHETAKQTKDENLATSTVQSPADALTDDELKNILDDIHEMDKDTE